MHRTTTHFIIAFLNPGPLLDHYQIRYNAVLALRFVLVLRFGQNCGVSLSGEEIFWYHFTLRIHYSFCLLLEHYRHMLRPK